MKLPLLRLPLITLLGSCSLPLAPSLSLAEAHVIDGPVIVQRGPRYFLHFRREIPAGDKSLIWHPVRYRSTSEGGLFFFYGPVSSIYYGETIETSLTYEEGATEMAKAGKIYWLNPDGSTRKIPVVKAAAQSYPTLR